MSFPGSHSFFGGVKPAAGQRQSGMERNEKKNPDAMGRGGAVPAPGGGSGRARPIDAHVHAESGLTAQHSMERSHRSRRASRAARPTRGDAAVLPRRDNAVDSGVAPARGCQSKPTPNEKAAAKLRLRNALGNEILFFNFAFMPFKSLQDQIN